MADEDLTFTQRHARELMAQLPVEDEPTVEEQVQLLTRRLDALTAQLDPAAASTPVVVPVGLDGGVA